MDNYIVIDPEHVSKQAVVLFLMRALLSCGGQETMSAGELIVLTEQYAGVRIVRNMDTDEIILTLRTRT